MYRDQKFSDTDFRWKAVVKLDEKCNEMVVCIDDVQVCERKTKFMEIFMMICISYRISKKFL